MVLATRGERFFEFETRACGVAHSLKGQAATGESRYEVRVKPQSLVEVGERPIKFSLISEGIAAQDVRHRIFWINPNRLVLVGDGAIEVPLQSPCFTANGIGVDIFRVKADGLVEVGD